MDKSLKIRGVSAQGCSLIKNGYIINNNGAYFITLIQNQGRIQDFEKEGAMIYLRWISGFWIVERGGP